MNHLDSRSRDILVLLLDAEAPLPSSQIAARLGLSTRQVRWSLHQLQATLILHGIDLVISPRLGCCVDLAPQRKLQLSLELRSGQLGRLRLSPEERQRLILLALLTSDDPLPMKHFEHSLDVSRGTVHKDLLHVESWLARVRLTMARRPNYGIQVVGDEKDRREAMIHFLLESVGETQLIAVCGSSRVLTGWASTGEAALIRAVRALLSRWDIAYAKSLVPLIEHTQGLHLSDMSHISLVLILALIMQRVREGKNVTMSEEQVAYLRQRPEYAAAEVMGHKLAHHCRVDLPEAETAFLMLQLLRIDSCGPEQAARTLRRPYSQISEEAWLAAGETLGVAADYLHPCLKVDAQLYENLARHFDTALHLLRLRLSIRNPLLSDVKQRYPYIFQVARHGCTMLEQRIGTPVPEEEVGFVAMFLGAAMERLRQATELRKKVLIICHAGIATSWLLVSRVQTEFPDVDIAGVMSSLELTRRQRFAAIDAIISTIPLSDQGIPCVVVSPFLHEEDIDRLRSTLAPRDARDSSMARSPRISSPVLADLLTQETVAVGVQAKTWESVVEKAGQLLLRSNLIRPSFIEAMKEMIVEHGPYMVIWPGVALLHAHPDRGVRRLCMSLITVAEPVPFGHPDHDPVSIAVVLGASDDQSHLRALLQLNRLMKTPAVVDRIRCTGEKADVLGIIRTEAQGDSSTL